MKTTNKKTTIMTSIMIVTLLFAGSLFMGMQNAFATSLNIDDHSFESQDLGDGLFTVGGPDTYWIFTDGNSGYFDPDGTHMVMQTAFGTDVAWARSGATICQTTSEVITEGINYRLSVWVGDRSDGVSPGYDIQLLDASDDTLLASIDETDFPIVTDDWRKATLDYLVQALDPSIGNDLKICLSTPGAGPQTLFDNVSLRDLESDRVCNDDTDLEESICKTVIIDDESGNGIIAIGESVTYTFIIDVINNDVETWFDAVMTDSFPGDLAVGDVGADLWNWDHDQKDDLNFEINLECDLEQTGKKNHNEHLNCDVGDNDDLIVAESASVGVTAQTDWNFGQSKKYMRTAGEQGTGEYTSCGYHKTNPGATLSYFLAIQNPEVDDPNTITTGPTTVVPVYQSNILTESNCDGDGENDDIDNCPFTPNTNQLNTDFDEEGNACDADDDNDTVLDGDDNCPLIVNAGQEDFDSDGIGDACNDANDVDGDEVDDSIDLCGATEPTDTPIDPLNGCGDSQSPPI